MPYATTFLCALALTATGRDVALDHLEIVQCLQNKDNTIPLVVGKPTVMRVYPKVVDGGGPLSGISARLHAVRNGSELAGSPIDPDNGPIEAKASFDRARADDSLNFTLDPDWFASDTEFWAEAVLPAGTTDPNTGNNRVPAAGQTFPAKYRQSATLRIRYMRVHYTNPAFSGGRDPSSRIDVQSTCDWLRSIFPFDPALVTYLPWSPVNGIDFAGGDATGDIDGSGLITELNSFYTVSPDQADRLFAWTPEGAFSSNGLSNPLWGMGQGVVAFGNDTLGATPPGTSRYRRTFAHEVGHNTDATGLQHTDARLADDIYGYDSMGVDPLKRVVMRRYPSGDPEGPLDLFDFMRGGEVEVHAWITPKHYQHLLNHYAPSQADTATAGSNGGGNGGSSDSANPRPKGGAPRSTPLSALTDAPAATERPAAGEGRGAGAVDDQAPSELLVVRGKVSREDKGEFFPFYRIPANPQSIAQAGRDQQRKQGTHSVRFVGAQGKEILRISWTPDFRQDDAHDPIKEVPFYFLMPPPPGVDKVTLWKQDKLLTTRTVSDRTPAIAEVRRREDRVADGAASVTLSWDIHKPNPLTDDANVDLTHQVYYSADNGKSWQLVASGLKNQAARFDLDKLPAGEKSRFMVKTSDGYNVSSKVTEPFAVADHAPTAQIIAPRSGREYKQGAGVMLIGQASDPEDKSLGSDAFHWVSDQQGELGTGTKLVVRNLKLGQHSITLHVKDSSGKEGVSAPVTLTVTARPGR